MCMGLSLAFLSCSTDLYLFWGQYHTVLITVALQYSLKSGSLIPPALFFFLKIALAVQGLLCFHTNCEIFCSSSGKSAIGSLIGIALNLQIALGNSHFHSVDSSNSRTWYISPTICIIFNFFHQCLIIFCIQVFFLLRQVHPQIFYSFCCNGKWECFLDFTFRIFIISIQECQRFLCINLFFNSSRSLLNISCIFSIFASILFPGSSLVSLF